MKTTSRNIKNGKQPKKRVRDAVTNIVVLLLFAGVFTWMTWIIYKDTSGKGESEDHYLASLPAQQDTIARTKVCMADDFFQGDFPTHPVSVNNKVYYGCNAKTMIDLAEKENLRFAIDPVSNKRVDKATAIIVIHPDNDGKVVYLGSRDSYEKYLEALSKGRNKEKGN